MSFSNDVKLEICKTYKMPEGCKVTMLYGFLLTAKIFNDSEIELILESKECAEYILSQISKLFSVKLALNTLSLTEESKKTLYQIHIIDRTLCKNIYGSLNCGKYAEYISLLSLDEAITWSFIKGVFLGCGSVTDPEHDYHLEFIFSTKNSAILAENMLSSLSFNPKLTVRRNKYVVYFKDSESIEDILTGMGAVKMVLSLMDSKVIKDIRNKINRRNNCETANMKRTIDVATEQVEAIEIIIDKRGIDFLDDDLQKIAKVRLDNPEISLKEMSKILNGEFSKSGIDRRLKKLVLLAKDIRETVGK